MKTAEKSTRFIAGLPGPGRASRNSGVPTDDDLVNRRFNREGLNELGVSDITEHKTPWIPVVVATVGTTWWPVKQISVRRVCPSRGLFLVGR